MGENNFAFPKSKLKRLKRSRQLKFVCRRVSIKEQKQNRKYLQETAGQTSLKTETLNKNKQTNKRAAQAAAAA